MYYEYALFHCTKYYKMSLILSVATCIIYNSIYLAEPYLKFKVTSTSYSKDSLGSLYLMGDNLG